VSDKAYAVRKSDASPYPAAGVGIPFVFFYGIMWVVCFYVFAYLILCGLNEKGPEDRIVALVEQTGLHVASDGQYGDSVSALAALFAVCSAGH
jgi:hypothetical protein